MNGYEKAISMLNKGFECIALDKNKRPLHRFKDITIDESFLNANRQLYERTSVLGVLTKKVWCIDIDLNHSDNKNGFESIEANPFKTEIKHNAERTLIQATASGGMHIIFKKREGVPYSQKIGYLKGVDIKANNNNYFVLAGSMTAKGVYKANNKAPQYYEGELESRIFSTRGSYSDQSAERYSLNNILPNYDLSHVEMIRGNGGRGKQAYKRIIDGVSDDRNNDLYLAVSYCKACDVDIEPLKTLIGTVKGNDEFTAEEFNRTVESALNG
jgi:hypothetical protein